MESGFGKKGLNSIRTMRNVSKGPSNKVKDSSFLELYILEKERERLSRENILFSQKLNNIQSRLKEIENEVERLQLMKGYSKKSLENKKNFTAINQGSNLKEQNPIKKVRIDY